MKFNSDGEKIIYNALSRECPEYVILHSVFLNRHVKNISGEIDLLVLIPDHGFFCIEVKHGGVERLNNGQWRYTNRNEVSTINFKSPFQQINDAMHTLRSYIPDLFKDTKQIERFKKIMFGKAVFFTSMDEFENLGTEAERCELFLRKNLKDVKKFFSNLSKYWHDKYSNTQTAKWYNNSDSRPTRKECEIFRNALRGDFKYDYSLINRIVDDEFKINEFTQQQFDFIDSTFDNSRNLIIGGAGTGKTIMALEIARRKSNNSNFKVGLFCYNSLLGNEIKSKSKLMSKAFDSELCFGGTLSSFMIKTLDYKLTGNEDSLFWEERLPTDFWLFYADQDDDKKFDYLIIDEAQDLASNYFLDCLDIILKGGLKDGNWTFLGDFCNQALYTDPKIAIDNITERANYSKLKLKFNCRNPKIIHDLNKSLTGCEDLFLRDGMPQGEIVDLKFLKNTNEIKEYLHKIIVTLINKNIPLKRIAILFGQNSEFSPSYLEIEKFIQEGLTYESIRRYKGLENTYIVLLGFNELLTDEAVKLLYVGISRCNFKIHLLFSKSLEDSYRTLLRRNLSASLNLI